MYDYANDKVLLDKIRLGDTHAFQRLFEQYWEALFAAALKRLKSQTMSEDIVQEVFADIWKRRKNLEIKSSLKSYLHTAVKYHVFKIIQQRIWEENVDLDNYTLHSRTEDSLAFNELFDILEIALEKLPERQQVIFRMSRFEGLKSQEIAEKLNLSEQTVHNNLHKTLSSLRVELKEYTPSIIFILVFLATESMH